MAFRLLGFPHEKLSVQSKLPKYSESPGDGKEQKTVEQPCYMVSPVHRPAREAGISHDGRRRKGGEREVATALARRAAKLDSIVAQ